MSKEDLAESLRAIKEIEDGKGDDEEKEVTTEDQIKEFFKQVKHSGFNLTTSYSILKEILTKNNGAEMVSETGNYKMESGHWDKLPMKEIKGLLGFYIINFIAGSD